MTQQKTVAELLEETKRLQDSKKQKQGAPATQTTEEFEEITDIENNTFFQIMLNHKDEDERRVEIAKALTYDKTQSKEQNKARLKEFVTFKKYLQNERLKLSKEMINLMDPNAVAELSEVFEAMFKGIKDFEDRMKPMNDILMAIFKLRMEGGASLQGGVYREIEEDKVAAEQRKADIAQLEADLKALGVTVSKGEREVEDLSKKKRFKLFGKPSEATLAEIDKKKADLKAKDEETKEKKAALEILKSSPVAQTQFQKYTSEKEIIKKMLSTSREEHVANSEALIDAALTFIDDSRRSGLTALEKLEGLEERIETQDKNNFKLQNIYANLSEASVEAAKANRVIEAELTAAPEKESVSAKLKRESDARDIQDFINLSDRSAVDTIEVIGALGKEGFNIATMKTTVTELKANVDEQTSSGVATVAGGISTALTAYDQALVNETAKTVEGAADRMNEITDLTNQSQAVQQANNVGKQADKLKEAMTKMEDTSKLLGYIRDTKEDGMAAIKDAAARMKQLGDEVRQKQADVNAVGAKLDMQDSKGALADKFDKNATPARPAANDAAAAPARKKPTAARKKASLDDI